MQGTILAVESGVARVRMEEGEEWDFPVSILPPNIEPGVELEFGWESGQPEAVVVNEDGYTSRRSLERRLLRVDRRVTGSLGSSE